MFWWSIVRQDFHHSWRAPLSHITLLKRGHNTVIQKGSWYKWAGKTAHMLCNWGWEKKKNLKMEDNGRDVEMQKWWKSGNKRETQGQEDRTRGRWVWINGQRGCSHVRDLNKLITKLALQSCCSSLLGQRCPPTTIHSLILLKGVMKYTHTHTHTLEDQSIEFVKRVMNTHWFELQC